MLLLRGIRSVLGVVPCLIFFFIFLSCGEKRVPNAAKKEPVILSSSGYTLKLVDSVGVNSLAVDFVDPGHREIPVIALYITDPEDEIPSFVNRFSFEGHAYWMVQMENPFQNQFFLPVEYHDLPELALDLTGRYSGSDADAISFELPEDRPLKVSVVTFESQAEESFKTSTLEFVKK